MDFDFTGGRLLRVAARRNGAAHDGADPWAGRLLRQSAGRSGTCDGGVLPGG